jgi:2',3'-cyclic-nucleotide 2'-phosphodiesterase/3'-nucleotidase
MVKYRLKLLVLAATALLVTCTAGSGTASAVSTDTATLRILSTNDLHGQVTAFDYETNLGLPKNGLSKIATLVEQNREEVGTTNTLLVDDGDFFYDYTTNFFYEKYPTYDQPILKAMKLMDYDYITLGNHEFDYPWDYLKRQLEHTGMSDKVLVCNTVWHDSGTQVFSPCAVITKQLTTTGGGSATVRIGMIGSTTNSISTRRGDYVNEIDALNNYSSIVTEANRLKSEDLADIVVVLLHGGIGNGSTAAASENIGYALTKVSSIDAVVTGHTHEAFPDTGGSGITLSNVDATNGLINGKPVVATSSHARALGVIDLKLTIASDGTVSISSGKASLDYVTAATAESEKITSMFLQYKDKLKAGADISAYKLASGVSYNNYDTVVRDSNLFQLFNNAKIAYGQTYIAEHLPSYKNIPVIACTRNLTDYSDPYVMIKDTLSSSKVSLVLSESSSSRPSGYVQLYEINGKDLREWLEYNSSMYATQGTTFKSLLKSYVNANPKVSTLLQEKYVYNWNSQFVFDGITYTVDLAKKPRYYSDGTMVSVYNKRIKSLTYHGVEVTNTQKFVIVTDSGLPTLSFLPEEMVDSIKAFRDNATGKGITVDYIKRLNAFGSISVKADNNWSLTADTGYSFLLGIPKKLLPTVSLYSWNTGTAAETTSYSFLKGALPAAKQSINIVVSQGRSVVNNDPVPVIISASSKNAIQEIRYLKGTVVSKSDAGWSGAQKVSGNTFSTTTNGTYTIRVMDTSGNTALAYVRVDKYDADVLVSPVLNKLTNRNTTFTGTAVPYSTIHAVIGDNKYSTITKSDGTFSMTVIPPKAFSSIAVYAEYKGEMSATVTASVRKTGPDAVQMDKILVGDTHATGTTDPDTTVYALIWTTIYVGRGQADKYKSSEFYNSSYKIVETDISVDKTTGKYQILIPFVKNSMKVFVFAVDRFGVTSKSTMQVPEYY